MRTRDEIEAIIGSHRENERPQVVSQAILEVMLDIREALLDKDEARDAYFNATKSFEKIVEERMKGEQQMKELLEATKTANDGHPGWLCDDAHPNVTHEAWLSGTPPVPTYDNPYGPYETNEDEVETNGV